MGIGGSIALHLVVIAALLITLPEPAPVQTPPEESVSVEIVTPPEEEAQPTEEAKAEEAPPPAPPAEEPPAEEQPAEEQAQQPPPPEQAEPPAGAEAEQPPPPPPPAAEAEQAEAAPPPPSDEAATTEEEQPTEQEAAGGEPTASEEQPAEGQRLQVLRPVFEFGEEETGSQVSPDGNAAEAGTPSEQQAEEAAEPPDTPPEMTQDPVAESETETAVDTPEGREASQSEGTAPDASAAALPPDITPPSVDAPATMPDPSQEAGPMDGPQTEITAIPTARPPQPLPDDAEAETEPTSEAGPPLVEAKRLFSRSDTSDAAARTAMNGLARGMRASQLCTTELREQLRHATPAYRPEILPSYSLPEGTVLDIRRAAFRADAQWYDVRFRCEIDEGATKVVTFGFEVGDPVPRSQWQARGFPEF